MTKTMRMLPAFAIMAAALLALTGCGTEADAAVGSRVEITANGQFAPQVAYVKAGVPAELSYSQGVGCTTGVRIPELAIAKDLSKGPAVVKLPALKAGQYRIYCVHNVPMGTLVAE